MPIKSESLHGSVPDSSGAALLLIDVINDFEFEGGDKLLTQALPVARNIARLKEQAKKLKIPAIYVNDNFGRWQSDFRKIVLTVGETIFAANRLWNYCCPMMTITLC